jgi:hypothetical protein
VKLALIALQENKMTQFEISVPACVAVAFDEVFWRFVQAELADQPDPDVRLDAYSCGDLERRVATFGDQYQAAAFERHWAAAHRVRVG